MGPSTQVKMASPIDWTVWDWSALCNSHHRNNLHFPSCFLFHPPPHPSFPPSRWKKVTLLWSWNKVLTVTPTYIAYFFFPILHNTTSLKAKYRFPHPKRSYAWSAIVLTPQPHSSIFKNRTQNKKQIAPNTWEKKYSFISKRKN